jgi:hypothetical protein
MACVSARERRGAVLNLKKVKADHILGGFPAREQGSSDVRPNPWRRSENRLSGTRTSSSRPLVFALYCTLYCQIFVLRGLLDKNLFAQSRHTLSVASPDTQARSSYDATSKATRFLAQIYLFTHKHLLGPISLRRRSPCPPQHILHLCTTSFRRHRTISCHRSLK